MQPDHLRAERSPTAVVAVGLQAPQPSLEGAHHHPGRHHEHPDESEDRSDCDELGTVLTPCDPGHDGCPAATCPIPLEYQGRELAERFFAVVFRERRSFRLIPTRANGQPALGLYARDPLAEIVHASGLLVLTLAGHEISAITHFDNSVLPRFGLPTTLPA